MADDPSNSDKSRARLRITSPETAEEIARRLERDRTTANREREFGLEQSLAPFRVGSVKALNTVPLTRGLENEITYATPAKLAEMLRRDELDAALVSIVEPLLNDRYDILDGIAIASLGEVKSVVLAHRKPLEEAREIFCDPASLTGVMLLKVLLAERGLKPEFKPLESYEAAKKKDFVLLIGDVALDFMLPPSPGSGATSAPNKHEIFDLGTAWYELTNLPFVYAAWALRRGMETRHYAGGCARRKLSGWKRWITSSIPARNTMRISAGITSAGTFITIWPRMRSAASRNFASCSRSTASARCMSRSL